MTIKRTKNDDRLIRKLLAVLSLIADTGTNIESLERFANVYADNVKEDPDQHTDEISILNVINKIVNYFKEEKGHRVVFYDLDYLTEILDKALDGSIPISKFPELKLSSFLRITPTSHSHRSSHILMGSDIQMFTMLVKYDSEFTSKVRVLKQTEDLSYALLMSNNENYLLNVKIETVDHHPSMVMYQTNMRIINEMIYRDNSPNTHDDKVNYEYLFHCFNEIVAQSRYIRVILVDINDGVVDDNTNKVTLHTTLKTNVHGAHLEFVVGKHKEHRYADDVRFYGSKMMTTSKNLITRAK